MLKCLFIKQENKAGYGWLIHNQLAVTKQAWISAATSQLTYRTAWIAASNSIDLPAFNKKVILFKNKTEQVEACT